MDKKKHPAVIEKLSDTLHVSLEAFLAVQKLRCRLGLTRKEIASHLILKGAGISEIVGELYERK